MKRFKFSAVVVLMLALSVFSFAFGCKKDNDKITLTFVTNGGSVIAPVEVKKGMQYTLPNATKENSRFDGWYLSDNFTGDKVEEFVAEADTTFYAKWVSLYTLTFVSNGGTTYEPVVKEAGAEHILPVPQKSGYEFEGWYLNDGFTGSPVTTQTVSGNVTFYAKWSMGATITLILNGGSLPSTTLTMSVGGNVYNFMSSHIPTKADHIFGAWYVGETPLSTSTLITESGITLTAKYKIIYKTEIFLQNLEGDGYSKSEDVVAYDYAGATVTANATVDGFSKITHESQVTSLVLTETPSENVLRLYFNRLVYSVKYNLYDGITQTVEVRYGQEVEVLSFYEREGYCLVGFYYWPNPYNTVFYKTNYIETNLCNTTTPPTVTPDKFVVKANMVLLGEWIQGYGDLFGGSDYIYLDEDSSDVAYLSRGGMFFKGSYNEQTKEFVFRNPDNTIMYRGKLLPDGYFSFRDLDRDGYASILYTIEAGLVNSVVVYFDAYNGITFSEKQEDNTYLYSYGTYIIDEDGYYIATFTSGSLQGKTLTLIFGKVNNASAFQIRNEEEYNMGELTRFIIADSEFAYYTSAYQIILTGFGIAYYNTGSSYSGYYYIYDSETKQLTLLNSDGSVSGILKVMEVNGLLGYMNYSESMDQTFTSESGTTLQLDGVYVATYTNGSKVVSGNYSVASSVFGGVIVKFACDGTNYTFLINVKSVIVGTDENDQPIYETRYTLEEKANGYIEYYYMDRDGTYYAPLLVINDTTAGSATIYGYTSSKAFEKVSSGTYTQNSGLYIYTASKYYDAPNVYVEPIDLSQVKSFVFALDSETSSYSVHYWYSMTLNNNDITTFEVKEYQAVEGDASLTFVAGFAIYTFSNGTVTGTYSTKNGVTTITTVYGNLYVELDDETDTFITYITAPYTSYEIQEDGSAVSSKKLTFDGKGGVIYTIDGVDYVGNYAETEEETEFGYLVYLFTAEGMTFKFIQLATSSNYYFAKYNPNYNGTYESEIGTLQLDGYGYLASYHDKVADVFYRGMYYIYEEGTICVYFNDTYNYFDILEGKTFTIRGYEYGMYMLMDNQSFLNTYFEFDGYGKLIVYALVDNGNGGSALQTVDAAGTYTNKGDEYTLNYKIGSESVTLIGKRSLYIVDSTTAYRVFIISHKEILRVYVNQEDWTVLVFDDIGNATKYNKSGAKELGTYMLITDSLLYFVNEDATDACIYKYDDSTGRIVAIEFRERGYYTKDLESMLFSKYGFIVFNGAYRYYYNIEDGIVTIYRKVNEGEEQKANEYGFVSEVFGEFDSVKTYGGKTYYANSGFAIMFKRVEATKTAYPILVEGGKKPFENLIFTPSGGATFNVSGTVTIAGKDYSCYIVKTDSEMFIAIPLAYGYYRFDITLSYLGGEATNSNSYEVLSMSYISSLYSYTYLYYSFLYMMMGGSIPNTFGNVVIIEEFDASGEVISSYVTAQFGPDSGMYDTLGNLIAFEKAEYLYFEASGIYAVKFVAADDYTYCLYFLPSYFSYLDMFGYQIYALTRVETITSGDYDVVVERIIVSENGYSAGTLFSVTLKQNGEVIQPASIYVLTNGDIYYIVREKNEDNIITATVYYKITLNKSEGGAIEDPATTVVPYVSVVITSETMVTMYSEDGKSYVDISAQDGVVLIVTNNTTYLIESCEYNAATETYIAVTYSGRIFEVTKDTSGENQTVQIVEVVETP